jgi:hypothetical protein
MGATSSAMRVACSKAYSGVPKLPDSTRLMSMRTSGSCQAAAMALAAMLLPQPETPMKSTPEGSGTPAA